MKLTFLGTGSAFTVGTDNFQSNMVVEAPGHDGRLLIDCGSDVRHSAHRHGLRLAQITDIYVSHLHADHIGGLEWVALAGYFSPDCPRPRLLAREEILDMLWENALKAGLSVLRQGEARLDTYFQVEPIAAARPHFTFGGIRFDTVPLVHVEGPAGVMTSYGLEVEAHGRSALLTTDSCFAPDRMKNNYDRADVIFQDCEIGARSGVHAHYADLVTLPEEIRRKIWLYHYPPGPLPDAQADGFQGFVKPGQCFDFARPDDFQNR